MGQTYFQSIAECFYLFSSGGHNFQADSKILVKKQRAKVDKTILKNTKVEDSHCQFKRYRKATAMSRVY